MKKLYTFNYFSPGSKNRPYWTKPNKLYKNFPAPRWLINSCHMKSQGLFEILIQQPCWAVIMEIYPQNSSLIWAIQVEMPLSLTFFYFSSIKCTFLQLRIQKRSFEKCWLDAEIFSMLKGQFAPFSPMLNKWPKKPWKWRTAFLWSAPLAQLGFLGCTSRNICLSVIYTWQVTEITVQRFFYMGGGGGAYRGGGTLERIRYFSVW